MTVVSWARSTPTDQMKFLQLWDDRTLNDGMPRPHFLGRAYLSDYLLHVCVPFLCEVLPLRFLIPLLPAGTMLATRNEEDKPGGLLQGLYIKS
jgi:hypothetical protein